MSVIELRIELRAELKKIALKVQEILHKLGLIADYVVETDGNAYWKWAKWASGKMVMWCNGKNSGTGTASGSSTLGYDFLLSITLPEAFTNIENVSGYASTGSAWGVLSGWTMMGTVTLRINVSGYTNSTSIGYSIKIIGTWK